MTAARNLIQTDEAHWQGIERCWASITQYPPRKDRSSWWLVAVGAVLVIIAIGAKL